MMSKQSSSAQAKVKPYPRRCAICGEIAVARCLIPYKAEVRHDGKLHAFSIASLGIDQCERCGEQFFTTSTDEEINLALRSHLGLLAPNEILTPLLHSESQTYHAQRRHSHNPGAVPRLDSL